MFVQLSFLSFGLREWLRNIQDDVTFSICFVRHISIPNKWNDVEKGLKLKVDQNAKGMERKGFIFFLFRFCYLF